jgi:hypothetical protein
LLESVLAFIKYKGNTIMMDAATQSQIDELVKKSLPGQVGDLLAEELKDLERLRNNEQILKDKIVSKDANIKTLEEKVTTLTTVVKTEEALNARESAIALREFKIELKDLELKLSNERRQEMLGVLNTVFKSPVYQSTVFGHTTAPQPPNGPGMYSNQGATTTLPFSSNVTTAQQP